jgi:hypothetical protein
MNNLAPNNQKCLKAKRINEYITLRLIKDPNGEFPDYYFDPSGNLLDNEALRRWVRNEYYKYQTAVYVGGELFMACSAALMNIKSVDLDDYKEIESIDEAIEIYEKNTRMPLDFLDPETEFFAHCSNMEAWVKHEYNTALLDMRLAFPLLKKLTELGDPLAKGVFKEEVARRVNTGYEPVIRYLLHNGYMKDFTEEEVAPLKEAIKSLSEFKIGNTNLANFLVKNKLGEIIKEIHLHNRNFDIVPGWIQNASFAEYLDLYGNNIKELPDWIGELTQLKTITLRHNQLRTLPESFGKLKNLQKLVLKDNQIEQLPESFGELKSLTYLKLNKNCLESLPNSFKKLKKLEELDLCDNKLKVVPHWINELTSLTKLELQRNTIESLPESIWEAPSLKKITMFDNKLDREIISKAIQYTKKHYYRK